VNQHGLLRVEARQVGKQTMLAQIIRIVEQAQGSKLPIQRLADRVVRVFTPIVFGVALVTFAVWLALGPAPAITLALVSTVAVLVVACPCAMGLATPAAIMVGSGRAAELGVLFRKGEALEALSHVDTVVFDKTGTLTLGRPQLTDVEPAPGRTAEELLRFAAAAESGSEHPLAAAILMAARERGVAAPKAERFEAIPGYGVMASVEGRSVLLGAERLLTREGVQSGAVAAQAAALAERARTAIWLAVDGAVWGALGVADPLKSEAAAVVAALKARGLRVGMITGDSARTAQAIARQAGLDSVEAEVLPSGKAEAVQRLQTEGRKVAFVGDGINDAPALAQAEVGVAVATGTDIAIEAADVTLTRGDLGGLLNALEVARLQHPADSARRRGVLPGLGRDAQPDARRPGDGSLERVRGDQQPAPAARAPGGRPPCGRSRSWPRPRGARRRRHVAGRRGTLTTKFRYARRTTMQATTLKVSGMTCNHCVMAVTKALGSVPGVEAADVSLEKAQAVVKGSADAQALIAAVKEEGYEATLQS